MSPVSTSSLSDAIREIVGNRPVYNLSVTSNGSTISSFDGGSATVRLPYTLKAGEDPNAVVVYCIDASGTLQTMQGSYDTAGAVTFVTTHFSEYMIGYKKVNFSDVSDTAWYSDAVTFLAARGITAGTTAASFSPDTALTRGQFIAMLLRAYGVPADANPTENFSDAGNTYYTGYLAAAKRLGIASGVGDNRFAPAQAITRQEMFTLLYRALKVLDQQPSGASGKTLADFSDASDIAPGRRMPWPCLLKPVPLPAMAGSSRRLAPQHAPRWRSCCITC